MRKSKTQTSLTIRVSHEVKAAYVALAKAADKSLSAYFLALNNFPPNMPQGRPRIYHKQPPRVLIDDTDLGLDDVGETK